MKHLDEARIVAIRDGADVDDAAREHVERCATCAAALDDARGRAAAIEHALSALDRPIEPTAAKAGVRARIRAGAAAPARRRWGGRHLGRAAALLLVTAGAAAALPGSPIRTLLLRPLVNDTPNRVESIDAGSAGVAAAEVVPELTDAGIAVAVPDGFVQVFIRGADPGTEVSVRWTEQSTARVSAPSGSRFTYSAGRIEVDAARGDIHMQLPQGATEVDLEVDGVRYLSGSRDRLEVSGPTVDRTDDVIRFRVDAP